MNHRVKKLAFMLGLIYSLDGFSRHLLSVNLSPTSEFATQWPSESLTITPGVLSDFVYLNRYDAVHIENANSDMDEGYATLLHDYVRNGGGIIITQRFLYTIYNAKRQSTRNILKTLVPSEYDITANSETMAIFQPTGMHPEFQDISQTQGTFAVLIGIKPGFIPILTATENGGDFHFAVAGESHRSVFIGMNFTSPTNYRDPNLCQLMRRAIIWATDGGEPRSCEEMQQ